MTNHLVMAVIAFAALLFAQGFALLARSLDATGRDSSHLQARMALARKTGFGWPETLAQGPAALLLQKWIAFALAAAALIFTVWHASMAFFSE